MGLTTWIDIRLVTQLLGIGKCKAFMVLQSLNRRDPKFLRTGGQIESREVVDVTLSLAKGERSLVFLHELFSSKLKVQSTKASRTTNPEMLPTAFATSVQRGLRRTLEEVTGPVDNAEGGPTVEA